MSPVHQVWPNQSCKARWKGGEDKADRKRGGKTTSRNGHALSSPSPRGQWRTEKTWRKLVVKSSVMLQRPLRLRDRWRWKRLQRYITLIIIMNGKVAQLESVYISYPYPCSLVTGISLDPSVICHYIVVSLFWVVHSPSSVFLSFFLFIVKQRNILAEIRQSLPYSQGFSSLISASFLYPSSTL